MAVTTRNHAPDDHKFEIAYLTGMKSRQARKTFKNQAAYEKWLQTDAGDEATVLGSRPCEDCPCGLVR